MSLYSSVQDQIRQAYASLSTEYDDGLLEHLLLPDVIHEVSLPILMDDGTTRSFVGYRSQHSNIRGPYKGGIRFHQNVSKDEVMALSAWMSIKCSVVGIPLGGGKGGVIVNPKTLSKRELESLSRAYMRAIAPYVGPTLDVPAPDVNTNPQIMAWMLDEYEKVTGTFAPGVITGKPLALGGSAGRGVATATGGFYVLERYLASKDVSIAGKTIAVQGAGNAGLIFAEIAQRAGAVVVAISDSRGAVHSTEGLSLDAIKKLKAEGASVVDYSGGTILSNEELLQLDVDVLVPAALEDQITDENVGSIVAPIILELANGPVSAAADELLFAKGTVVIPDVLANAGGVTVSYFEQVQNGLNYYWDEEEVDQKLRHIMNEATDDVLLQAGDSSLSLRMASYVVSLKRMLDALALRRDSTSQ